MGLIVQVNRDVVAFAGSFAPIMASSPFAFKFFILPVLFPNRECENLV